MLKKLSFVSRPFGRCTFFVLCAFALLWIMTACGSYNGNEDGNDPSEYEEIARTPEALRLRAEFELFFEENKADIIASVATDGEDVRLELAEGYEFIMTILLDDIVLDDENRAVYILTFELTFSQMNELFGGLAEEIREAADVNYFRLSVVFVDINEEMIAQSSFDAGDRRFFLDDSNDEFEEETDVEATGQ